MAAKKKKSKAPTGLQISRKDHYEDGKRWFTLSCSWNQGESYEKQEFWYRRYMNGGYEQWKKVSISASATNFTLSHYYASYYPYKNGNGVVHNKYNGVQIRVCGKSANKTTSDWKYKSFDVLPPDPVSDLKYELTGPNSGTFSWDSNFYDTGQKLGSLVEYRLVGSYKRASDNQIINDTWGSIKTKAAGNASVNITEDVGAIDPANCVYFKRGICVRSVGPDNHSDWKYKYYFFSKPYTPTITSGEVKVISATTASIDMAWTTTRSLEKPIDSVDVEYLVAVPGRGFTIDMTNNESWTKLNTYVMSEVKSTTKNSDRIIKTEENLAIPDDNVVWLRVTSTHGYLTSSSKPFAAKLSKASSPSGMKGIMPKPTTSASPFTIGDYDSVTGTTTITYVPSSINMTSAVPDAEVKILFRYKNSSDNWVDNNVLGYLEADDLSTSNVFSVNKNVANLNEFQIGLQNVQTTSGHETVNMSSSIVWLSAKSYAGPEDFTVESTTIPGTIKARWNTNIPKDVNALELSWADHEDAWYSTSGPTNYSVYDVHRGDWNIAGLSAGQKYYVRARFIYADDDTVTYSNWSQTATIKRPQEEITAEEDYDKPAVMVANDSIPADGTLEIYWSYSVKSGESQTYAEVSLMDVASDNGTMVATPNKTIATTSTKQSVTIQAQDLMGNDYNLAVDTIYYISVRIASSGSNEPSDWSEPVPFSIRNATEVFVFPSLTTIEQTSSVTDPDNPTNELVSTSATNVLTVLPLTIGFNLTNTPPVYPVSIPEPTSGDTDIDITQTGGTVTETVDGGTPVSISTDDGSGIELSVIIERSVDVSILRPDDSTREGHEGETIFSSGTQTGLNQIVINQDNLIGRFDDGCWYRIVVSTKNQNGIIFNPEPIEFMVDWEHDATMPTADIAIDNTNYIAEITPGFDSGNTPEGDTFEIYRLSNSYPQLIARGSYGETFIDPYPSFGAFGGYRIVDVTENGDYTTDISLGNAPAWYDFTVDEGYDLDIKRFVVEFNGRKLILKNNLVYNNSWEKDFQRTSYLGGSVVGSWNKAVTMNSSANTVIPVFENDYDQDTIALIKELAEWPGVCHVRTPDGGSYQADVQVTEDRSFDALIASYSLNIQKIDPDGLEAIPLSVWQGQQGEE